MHYAHIWQDTRGQAGITFAKGGSRCRVLFRQQYIGEKLQDKAIAIAGPIGFVGFLAAYCARLVEPVRLAIQVRFSALFGVLFLLAASFAMWREVSLSVRSFDLELDQELTRRRG